MTTPIRWGDEFLVNATAGGHQLEPVITALADGRFIVGWSNIYFDENSTTGISARISGADGTERHPEFLMRSDPESSGRDQPAIATLADGRFIVAWQDYWGDGSGTGVYAQIFNPDGTNSGSEFLVNTKMYADQSHPVIAPLSDGRFVVAWWDEEGTTEDHASSSIRAQIFNADGSKTAAPFFVNTAMGLREFDPAITSLIDGRFVVMWRDWKTILTEEGPMDKSSVHVQVFNPDGTRAGSELYADTPTGWDATTPQVVALAGGGFAVGWAKTGEASSPARVQIFNSDGTRSGGELGFGVDNLYHDTQLAIGALADGRFVVAWSYPAREIDANPTDYEVHAQVLNSDGTKSGDEFLVSTFRSESQANPSISVLADGRFVIGWTHSGQIGGDGSGSAVRAQVFDPRGAAVQFSGTGLDDEFAGTIFDDQIAGSIGHDKLWGASGGDLLSGGEGNDCLYGGLGNDAVQGGDGDDTVDGGAGDDRLEGGTGNDTYIVTGADTVLEALNEGLDEVRSVYSFTLAANLENLLLTGSSISNGTGNELENGLTGNSSANTLLGLEGDDALLGGGGNDWLDGGAGTDRLEGGVGNDTYVLAAIGDLVLEGSGAGTDTVYARYSYSLGANVENLLLTGTGFISGTGNALANWLSGNGSGNTLQGLGGDDRLDGGTGADRLEGGLGNDTYVLATSGDTVVELAAGGIDQVNAGFSYVLGANLENLVLTGTAALNGTGNGLANRLTGNSGANNLQGGDGGDTLDGAAGADVLGGGAGSDRLLGGAGADKLQGGASVDTVTGGLGNDVFVFAAPGEAGDVVTDFRNVSGDNDLFHIRAAAFGGGLVGGRQLAASQFQIANDTVLQGTAEAGIRFIFEADTTKLWFDSNGSAAGGLRLVADLQVGATLTAADIWLI